MLFNDLLEILSCPYEHSALERDGEDRLRCPHGHSFPIVQGVPVLVRADAKQTLWVAGASWEAAQEWVDGRGERDPYFVRTLGLSDEERAEVTRRIAQGDANDVDPVISFMVGATSGILYKDVIGKLSNVPVSVFPLEATNGGERLLDIGCNWGRWSVAAAQKGYSPVGIDPSLGGVLAAKRLAEKLGLRCQFVCGDGRFLPFANGVFSRAFSYSVIQHMSPEDAGECLKEIQRVPEPGGHSLIQMPNCFGARSLYHLARRRFRKATNFDVRYWTPAELLKVFGRKIGPSTLSIDGFLGLGVQASDRAILPLTSRVVVTTSESLKALARFLPPLKYLADSLYVTSTASGHQARPVTDQIGHASSA